MDPKLRGSSLLSRHLSLLMKFRAGENPGLTARSWASENRSLVVRWASEISRNILLVIISSQNQFQNLRLQD